MADVHIAPLPQLYRQIPAKFRPSHPPIFDADPTPEDIALARELFALLDEESRDWYGGTSFLARRGCAVAKRAPPRGSGDAAR